MNFNSEAASVAERIQAFDQLLKFLLRRRLVSCSLTRFLKTPELLPVFERRPAPAPLPPKGQSVEENASPLRDKSNRSADALAPGSNSERTNVISLGDKLQPREKREEFSEDSNFFEGSNLSRLA